MTEVLTKDDTGIVNVGGVLSAATIIAIEKRMIIQASAVMVARKAGMSLIKPKPYKFIPYVGWAIAIGATLYVAYEAYKSFEINYRKLENDIYDEKDMEVFRMGYTEASRRFADTRAGVIASEANRKYILIPAEVMPVIAAVDTIGMEQYVNVVTWDPANGPSRRTAVTSGRGPAGPFTYSNGNVVRGSWEEYPFAATRGPIAGAYVDRAPLRENWIQGGFIRAAAMVQSFTPGDTIFVYILG